MSNSPRYGEIYKSTKSGVNNSPAKSLNGSIDSNISAMLHLKNNCKRVENDLQLLFNRVALLRNEEERALNKIEETKHRAKEILLMRRKSNKVRARTAKMMSGDEQSRAAKEKVATKQEKQG